MKEYPFDNLEPQNVWRHFYMFTQTPRPSGGEQAIIDKVKAWAEINGFEHRSDKPGNLSVFVPASVGKESVRPLLLQAHVDMVCERQPGSVVDPATMPLDIYVEDGKVCARGTTLGADNAMGAAMAMAAAEDTNVKHGPLVILFTVEEETGLGGAFGLDSALGFPDKVNTLHALNLDEEKGPKKITTRCAGGADVVLDYRPSQLVTFPMIVAKGFRLTVGGLKGGHSGEDIAKCRGNAIKLAFRFLRQFECCLDEVVGGGKRNAIPRDCTVTGFVSDEAYGYGLMEWALPDYLEMVRRELTAADNEGFFMTLEVEGSLTRQTPFWSFLDSRTIMDLLMVLPSGPLAMDQDIVGLTRLSSNVGVVRLNSENCQVVNLVRGSLDSEKSEVVVLINLLAERFGAQVTVKNPYSGWVSDPERSKVVKGLLEVWKLGFGVSYNPEIGGTHGGLECGIIGGKLGIPDWASFGPIIEGAHSLDENMDVESVGGAYLTLCLFLERWQ